MRTARVVGVLGAGIMGAGIAYACAAAGLDVRLKDVRPELAQRGRGYSETLVERAVGKAAMTGKDAEALVGRIDATDKMADLADADLIIEAVFVDSQLKQQVYAVPAAAGLGRNGRRLQHLDPACRSPASPIASRSRNASWACTSSRPSTAWSWSRSSPAARPAT
jgi:hypothetical protein